MPGVVWLIHIGQKLVGAAAALGSPAPLNVFKAFESGKMRPGLELGPAATLPQLTAAKKGKVLFDLLTLADFTDKRFDAVEQSAGLWRELIE